MNVSLLYGVNITVHQILLENMPRTTVAFERCHALCPKQMVIHASCVTIENGETSKCY